jgi:tetratricopeptide (TPR) repeat protein
MNLGNIHSAMEDANTVLQIDPQSPEAYLLLGQAHELQEQYLEAMAAYEQASSLASEHNRPEIAALARIRLAYLMQRMPAGSP